MRHRNFRLFFLGQGVSLMGTWMTRLALSWLTYRLTGSALLLGLVGFSGQIGTALLSPFAGVWVDRWDKRRLLVWTQILSGLQSLALAALTLSGHITIHEVIWLAALQGIIDAFDMPARQSFMIQMVGAKQGRSQQRDCLELVHGERGAAGRAGGCGLADREGRRGLLFSL